MTVCSPCLKARAAAKAMVRDVASGRLAAVRKDAGDLADALREKAESLRIRERLFGRR